MNKASFEDVVTSSVPPTRLFKAMILDADNLLPKVTMVPIKNVRILEGDGGVGTVKAIYFAEESRLGSAKQRTDEIDESNLIFKCSVIEGYALEEGVESISYAVKIESTLNGGSIVKTTVTYHTQYQNFQIPENKIKDQKIKSIRIIEALEAYLSAHPRLYI